MTRAISLTLGWLGLMGLFGCTEQTQTIVIIDAKPALKALIGTASVETFNTATEPATPVQRDELSPVQWPVRHWIRPGSPSASHKFRLAFSAMSADAQQLFKLEVNSVVVEGATRYLRVFLDDDCLVRQCPDNQCAPYDVGPDRLTKHQEPNVDTQLYCTATGRPAAGSVSDSATAEDTDNQKVATSTDTVAVDPASNVKTAGANTAGSPGSAPGVATSTAVPTGMSNTTVTTTMPAATGVMRDPTFTPLPDGPCANNPCVHGVCGKTATGTGEYQCDCEVGYQPDAAAKTCVPRNDCLNNKGGCDGTCQPTETGEASCSCDPQQGWLKGDRKHCGAVQTPVRLQKTASTLPTRPQVAFDEKGNGVAAWFASYPGGARSIWAARYTAASTGWGEPFPIMTMAKEAAELTLAVAPSGRGLLVWSALDAGIRKPWAASFHDNEFHVLLDPIDKTATTDVLMPAVSVNAEGDGIVVWTVSDYPGNTLKVARYAASLGGFTSAQSLTDTSTVTWDPRVALANSGDALATWVSIPIATDADGGMSVDLVNTRSYNRSVSPLGPAYPFDTGRTTASTDVAFDTEGNAVTVWLRRGTADATTLEVMSQVRPASSAWRAEQRSLSSPGTPWSLSFIVPRLALAPSGTTTIALWQEWVQATQDAPVTMQTHAALRGKQGFGSGIALGLEGELPSWMYATDGATQSTPESLSVNALRQPAFDGAIGPNDDAFVVGSSFRNVSPIARTLWLQRWHGDQPPGAATTVFSDNAPNPASPPALAINSQGDGAIVWDTQTEAGYVVMTSLLR